ncbi:DUF2141 domain-containing protein [Spirosoma sordidisoli]|uniref:DUF2141 domain-containing protein n=1 Tax=Spirosoma sordidisoli TaxID=2502893 RepID=A0A4Q2ULE1_9BACT|nr:DUF2141 domain-containing protein [Spirosoma sordidisoli]RYC68320.1 DUF2141 domain-containing protein [Spirosoma sordidisoli]
MKTLATLFFLMLSMLTSPFAFAQTTDSTARTYTVTVVVPNVTHRSGTIRVGVANSEATFNGESFKTSVVNVPASGEVQVTLTGLPAGRYAVRLMQDLNGNEKMDYNGQMPAEPFGFSNVTMLMGPPSFGQCAFDLNENKQIRVGLMEM